MLEKIGLNTDIMIICMFVFIFVLLVLVFMLLSKTTRLTKKYVKYMKGANGKSLENKFEEKFDKLEELESEITELRSQIYSSIEVRKSGFCKFALEKYDAFMASGGKLSFSICLLTEENDGFILTSVHNSDGCYTYLKEVIKGQPYIKMSEQEGRVLQQAIKYYDITSKDTYDE